MAKKEQILELIKAYENETEFEGQAINEQKYNALATDLVKLFAISVVSSSSIPKPPKPPLCRVLRTGVGHFCKNCNSTMSRYGFLMIFGKRFCDNKKCPNSKPEKNYY